MRDTAVMHTFTDKGWFGICPVYFAGLDTPAPVVDPRHWLLAPLMWVSEAMFSLAFAVGSACQPGYEPEWPLRVTGELDPPIRR